VLAARLEGRDPASEKREAHRRITVDTVAEIIALYVKQHLSTRRSGRELTRLLQRELVARWGSRSVHETSKRDIIDLITAVVDRGAPVAANKTLKVTRAFFSWCVGRAILERSPCDGVRAPTLDRWNAHVDRILNGPPEYFWRLREQPPSRHGGAGRVHSACLGRITEEAIRAQKFYGAA
jgi:hypothetical protein